MNKNQNNFTKSDIGASVVFAGFDGGSYSATIVDVRAAGIAQDRTIRIAYWPTGPEAVYVTLVVADWHRLTRFGTSNFLALEVEASTR